MVKLTPTSLKILSIWNRFGGIFVLMVLALNVFHCYVGSWYEIIFNVFLVAMNLYTLRSWARTHSFFLRLLDEQTSYRID